jgi:hypothetical protein
MFVEPELFLSLSYIHSCHLGSGSDIIIIPLNDDSCVYMFSFTGSGSHIVIIPLTDDSCVCSLLQEVVLILLSHIYTAVIIERNDNNIRTTSYKREHIYTAVLSEKNDNNIRTTSC